jgi:hypothetical protein
MLGFRWRRGVMSTKGERHAFDLSDADLRSELSLDNLLADEIVRLRMLSDGVTEQEIRVLAATAQMDSSRRLN